MSLIYILPKEFKKHFGTNNALSNLVDQYYQDIERLELKEKFIKFIDKIYDICPELLDEIEEETKVEQNDNNINNANHNNLELPIVNSYSPRSIIEFITSMVCQNIIKH